MFRILLLIAFLVSSCKKTPEKINAADPIVEKNIQYVVYANKDYSPDKYTNVQVSLTLSAGFISKSTGAFTKVWDTTIVNKLPSFPSNVNPILFNKKINVNEKDQILQVSKGLTYIDNSIITQKAKVDPVPSGVQSFVFTVQL